MDQIIIIADDLTGACDSGIKFRNAGFETLVLTDVSEEDVQAAGRCAETWLTSWRPACSSWSLTSR